LLSVRGTETKPGSDVRGWSEMVGEVPRCLTMQAEVHTPRRPEQTAISDFVVHADSKT